MTEFTALEVCFGLASALGALTGPLALALQVREATLRLKVEVSVGSSIVSAGPDVRIKIINLGREVCITSIECSISGESIPENIVRILHRDRPAARPSTTEYPLALPRYDSLSERIPIDWHDLAKERTRWAITIHLKEGAEFEIPSTVFGKAGHVQIAPKYFGLLGPATASFVKEVPRPVNSTRISMSA